MFFTATIDLLKFQNSFTNTFSFTYLIPENYNQNPAPHIIKGNIFNFSFSTTKKME